MRVLPEVSPVPELFPAVCTVALSQRGSRSVPSSALSRFVQKRLMPSAPHEGEDEISAEDDREPGEVCSQQSLRGTKKFPMVLMLEPLHACNLTCTGCGRIREYKSTIDEMLTVEECVAAVEDSGAPIVSICGGEPMIYPGIGKLASEILSREPAHHSLH